MNPRTILPIALILTLGACASTGNQKAPAAGAPEPAAASKDDANADALKKKERELQYAKLQFQITELELQADTRGQQASIADAERGVRNAEEDLSDYLKTQRALESTERALGSDQQQEGVRESQQELEELESMYKDEDFANKTKELVLSRGRARLDFSRRGFELAKSRREFQEATAAPRKERDLRETLDKARRGLEDTRASAERKKLSNQLQLMRAKDGLDDLEKEVAKLKQPAA
ncbi:MAG: hypothetical protein IPJ19_04210 [Planctomycetes bacterium]|nr:hypothetical protein [Planctomycetota bacterium]